MGLAATTNAVPNRIWSSIAERFVFDEEMRKRLEENNKFAAMEIVERLFEAEKKRILEGDRRGVGENEKSIFRNGRRHRRRIEDEIKERE